jgi:hypothetical protein
MTASRKHHYRIAKPFRFFVFILICIMTIVFAGYSIVGAADAQATDVRTYRQVVIQEDDNLWNLVERYNPDANINVRDAVYDIYEINDIDADDIQPGDTIFVPIY